MKRVYVQTNGAERNEVIAFDRSDDGRLEPLGSYETGGRGTAFRTLRARAPSSSATTATGSWSQRRE